MSLPRKTRSGRKDFSPIGRRLLAERTRIGLSQQQIGVQAGLHTQTAAVRINQYERGVHTPNFTLVKKLAQVIGIDASYFYCDDDEIAEAIRRLSRLDS